MIQITRNSQIDIHDRNNDSIENAYDSETYDTDNQNRTLAHTTQDITNSLPDYFLGKNGYRGYRATKYT